MKDSQFFSMILLIAFCVLAVPALGISWDITQLTDDDWDDSAARINSDGDVAWLKDFEPSWIDKQRDVFLYDLQGLDALRIVHEHPWPFPGIDLLFQVVYLVAVQLPLEEGIVHLLLADPWYLGPGWCLLLPCWTHPDG